MSARDRSAVRDPSATRPRRPGATRPGATRPGATQAGSRRFRRGVLTCCAADARPVKVGLAGQVPDELRPDIRLDVVGRYGARSDKDGVDGETVPYLDVMEAHEVSAPTEQDES